MSSNLVAGMVTWPLTRHAQQLFKVERSKVKVTKSRDVSVDKNAVTRQCMVISTSNVVGISYVKSTRVVSFLGQLVKQTGSRNMSDIQNIKCKNQRKSRKIAEIVHSNRKSGSANRTAVSKFTPEVHKQPFLRMRSTNIADNGRKCD